MSTEPFAIEAEYLTGWLTDQRWFGSKARDLSGVNILEALALRDGDEPLVLALVEARFQAGTHELYQLILGASQGAADGGEDTGTIRQGDGWELHDAVTDPRLLELIESSGEVPGERGCVFFRRTEGAPTVGADAVIRPVGAEQSNSSLILGDQQILKVFRRLQAGDNPELEMLRFLTEAGFENIARLDGWYEYSGDLMDATLGVLQEFVHGATDGWDLCLEALASGGGEEVIGRLRDLGRVTGEMHTALGASFHPDFAGEEPSAEALSLLGATIDEQIERTFLDLPQDLDVLAPIAGRQQEIRDRLQMMSHTGVGGRLIRQHGDYHLGQTLYGADERWIILDFEGEPARPLLERRRKRSPLRDVAGMLRSFAYAASAAELLEGATVDAAWEDHAREAFLEGYVEAVDPALLPAGQAAIEKQLGIFELEKAVYELRYELNNRPDWVRIPVAGIARLLEEDLPS